MGKFAIFKKKERWSTTWLGKVLILTLFIVLAWLFVKYSYSFLAQNSPVNSEIIILEGFLPNFAIEESMKIFNDGNYKLMIISGKKMIKGASLVPYENDGLYTAAILAKMGFDSTLIKVIGLKNDVMKDRTYASATAITDWMSQNGLNPETVNVISLGCHSRRSRLLFEKVFKDEIKIGIISVQDIGYDPEVWWKSSYGFKTILNEVFALTYTYLFFRPPD